MARETYNGVSQNSHSPSFSLTAVNVVCGVIKPCSQGGFAFEPRSSPRCTIQSPNIIPLTSPSSLTNIKPFDGNTIICGEVVTSNLTFNQSELEKLEMECFNPKR
ncbi:unnamed protein product [Rotaria socialis]|uniref:Uncharacterized protein n=2 Tax=Rotaria socialis TaxID=392032 RepID=A0A820XFT3_9BILA|nr:unnamed protein product [Rotaria socialis]